MDIPSAVAHFRSDASSGRIRKHYAIPSSAAVRRSDAVVPESGNPELRASKPSRQQQPREKPQVTEVTNKQSVLENQPRRSSAPCHISQSTRRTPPTSLQVHPARRAVDGRAYQEKLQHAQTQTRMVPAAEEGREPVDREVE